MLVVGLATVYTSCMLCGFLPRLIYLRSLIKKKIYQDYDWKCPEDSVKFKRILEKERIFDFFG